ncbi:RHS repeat-associated core domain-containing protein [Kordia sp.]|uniref:RHS repeat-associated core domain-containing protein n=1 Tax=Kordia sp. TaxID=1965332 RepID=UPI003D6B5ED1
MKLMKSTYIFKVILWMGIFCTYSLAIAQGDIPKISEQSNTYGKIAIEGDNISQFVASNINDSNTSFYNPEAYILLSVNNDIAPFTRYSFELQLKVYPVLSDGNPDTIPYDETLTVDFKPHANLGNSADQVYHKILNRYGAKVDIIGYTTTYQDTNTSVNEVPENIELKLGFKAIRVVDISNSPAPSVSNLVSNPENLSEYKLSWSTVEGAISYDVEWTWIDNYENSATNISLTEKEFQRNSTRINTKDTNYQISNIYDSGYIIYRVRAIGRFADDYITNFYGSWSQTGTNTSKVSDWAYATINGHEDNKNWQFQASYAEDGKKKEVVSYFDGTLRNRQTVTKINTDDNAIVGEVVYDNQGRPGIEILPAPTTSNEIRYYQNHNINNSDSKKYSHLNFDWDATTNDDSNCEVAVDGMKNTSGTSQYYSPNYTGNSELHDAVPDAQNYPFSQIEYTPDNTGRIKRKGGVGITHQLGNGHEMKYFYSKPSQQELDRLFGSDIGWDAHYKKNAVVDPNGQVSVSYVDPQGRTIATALAADNPEALDGLEDEENGNHVPTTLDLLNKVNTADTDTDVDNNMAFNTGRFSNLNVNDALRYNGFRTVLKNGTAHNFSYDLSVNGAFVDSCATDIPFAYDLSMRVKDECGNTLFTLEDPEINEVDETFSVTPPLGDLVIEKIVKVSEVALNYYTDQYITDGQASGCILDDSAFDISGSIEDCFPSCGECVDSITEDYNNDGNLNQDDYVQTQLSYYDNLDQVTIDALTNRFEREYDLLVEACMAPCVADGMISASNPNAASLVTNSISCNVTLQTLVNDMKLVGQYGKQVSVLNSDGEYQLEDITPELSVFDETNNVLANPFIIDLYTNHTNAPSTIPPVFSWKTPFNPNYDDPYHYYDANGEIVKVLLPIDGNVYGLTAEDPLNAGFVSIEPQDLNFVDFENYWQDQWAESLVAFHPEYVYSHFANELCQLTNTLSVLDSDENSQNFIVNVDGYANYLAQLSFTETLHYLNTSTSSSLAAIVNDDPLFQNISGLLTNDITYHRTTVLEAITSNFESTNNPMLYNALLTIGCNSISSNCTVDINNMTDAEKEEVWPIYRSMYLSFRDRIKSALANIYAIDQNVYNGCIGEDAENPGDPVLRLDQNGYTFPSQTIEATNNVCNGSENLYIEKIKRIISEDYNYDSNDSVAEVGEQLEALTDYQYYVQSGQCPMGRDFETFIKGVVEDTNILNQNSTPSILLGNIGAFEGNYLSMDLFDDLGGTPTSNTVQNSGIAFASSTTTAQDLAITISVNDPSTTMLPINLTIDDTTYDWNDYNATWQISEISQFAYSNTYNTAVTPTRFDFTMAAKVVVPGSTNVIAEIIISGNTIARIGECSVDGQADVDLDVNGNTIGEQLGNGGILNDAEACQDKDDLAVSLKNMMNAMLPFGATSVNLQSVTEYSDDDFLPEFLGDDPLNIAAVWSNNGNGNYTITIGGNTVLELSDVSDFIHPQTGETISFASLASGNISNENGITAINGVSVYGSTNLIIDAIVNYATTGHSIIYTFTATINALPYDCCTYISGDESTNTNTPDCGTVDNDNDGIFDSCDNCLKYSNPQQIDSDGDGIGDGCDNCENTYNPNQSDLDQDGIGDTCDDDTNSADCIAEIQANGVLFNTGITQLLNAVLATGNFYTPQEVSQHFTPELLNLFIENARLLHSDASINYTSVLWNAPVAVNINLPNTIELRFQNLGTTTASYYVVIELSDALMQNGIANNANFIGVDPLGLPSNTMPTEYSIAYNAPNNANAVAISNIYQSPDKIYNNLSPLNFACDLAAVRTNNGQLTANRNAMTVFQKENTTSYEPCTTCIPQTITPVDRDVMWERYTNEVADIPNYTIPSHHTLEYFDNMNYQYITEGYIDYLETFAGGTDVVDTNAPYFLTIAEFGATPLNYGFNHHNNNNGNGYLPVILAYKTYIDNSGNTLTPDDPTYKTWSEFVIFYLEQHPEICPPKPMIPTINLQINDDLSDCREFAINIAEAYGADNYNAYIERIKHQFKLNYTTQALAALVENFTVSYNDKEYQYTLYYYDQAGNLTQTVPPQGVERIEFADINSAQNNQFRENNATPMLPTHELKTQYKYNSLNQLVWQKTPDGGETVFAYDYLGRIIASQNAKQLEENPYKNFSYTRYDGLGRILEAGEIEDNTSLYNITDKGELLYNGSRVNNFDDTYESMRRREVTRTTYDDRILVEETDNIAVYSSDLFTSNYIPFNSINRVTAVSYYDEIPPNKAPTFDNALFYNYDVHGNVKELVTYITELKLPNCQEQADILDCEAHIKRVHYKYDLISGNVNRVTFQPEKPDQFIHAYEYDADNRIVSAHTSKDGNIWEQDANYKYYEHGPLARVEIGDKKVQGTDYIYTLHGWLKSVNGESLANTSNDFGYDGNATRSNMAKDAFGYALHYYDGDYTPTNTSISGNIFKLSNSNVVTPNTKNLYNGNIKTMMTSLRDQNENILTTQVNNYTYDQLNRIKAMQSKAVTDKPLNSLQAQESYASSYEFDRNGNLQQLNRKVPQNGILKTMDNFTYKYITENGNPTNKLAIVDDEIAASDKYETDADIEDQINFLSGYGYNYNANPNNTDNHNYIYDEIGQLIQDKSEGLEIFWRVDGKVKEVHKLPFMGKGVPDVIAFHYDGLGNRIGKSKYKKGNSNDKETTFYARDAQGNVLGIYDVTSSRNLYEFDLEMIHKEQHIYGSSRLGIENIGKKLVDENFETPALTNTDGTGIPIVLGGFAKSGLRTTSDTYFYWDHPTTTSGVNSEFRGINIQTQFKIDSDQKTNPVIFLRHANVKGGKFDQFIEAKVYAIKNLTTNKFALFLSVREEYEGEDDKGDGIYTSKYFVTPYKFSEDLLRTKGLKVNCNYFGENANITINGITYSPSDTENQLIVSNTTTGEVASINTQSNGLVYRTSGLIAQDLAYLNYYIDISESDAQTIRFPMQETAFLSNNLGEEMRAISTLTLTEADYIIPNAFYNDADNDGIDDYIEDTNQDGNADNDDTDGDGIANYLDADDDNDGVLTTIEGTTDTDNDSIANYLDTDDDNDGFLTAVEGQTDDDNDGTPNYLDNTYYENAVNGPLAYTNNTNNIGDKAYELSNHLGNVLSVISDKKILAYGSQTNKIAGDLEGFNEYGEGVELVLNGNLQCATIYNNTGTYFQADFNENIEYQIVTDITKDNYNADIKIEVTEESGIVQYTTIVTQGGETAFTFTAPAAGTYNIRFLKSHENTADTNVEAFYIKDFAIFTVVETQEVTGFLPDVLSYNDYYPYGMLLPKRHASDESYRYGFQGSEKDDELKGEGNSYTTHFRQYDPRIGKWLSLDPKQRLFPSESPFTYGFNNPVLVNDPNGDCPPCAVWAAIKGGEILIGLVATYVILDNREEISQTASYLAERAYNGANNLFSDAPLPVVSGGFDKYPIPQIGVETIPAVKEKLRERILEEVLPVVESAQLREGFDLLPLDLQAQTIEKIPAFKDSNFSNSVLNMSSADPFPNLMPESLDYELARAEKLGVEVMGLNSKGFDDMVVNGPIKFVVDSNGEMQLMSKFVDGEEISHAVLTKGRNVLTAGELMLAGSKEIGYFVLDISNHSGHFQPSEKSLQIAKDALKNELNILNNF